MRICFFGLENLPVLAEEYNQHAIGGEQVQQTLLAKAFAHNGYSVTMVVRDYGQSDGSTWESISTYKAYKQNEGIPVLRFIHPRWTKTWNALRRADADVYYTSCAGMHVGLVAMFCQRYKKKFVFRTASDTDCDRKKVRIPLARDRWLYEYGLRRADHILVQSDWQKRTLLDTYGISSEIAGMLVEQPPIATSQDIDVLWVGNIRTVKRADRVLSIAKALPEISFHMIGGALAGEESLFEKIKKAADDIGNIVFHGRTPYHETNRIYGRAKLLLNTSDVEGFPNSYLQAWSVGLPVITRIDPDNIIERERLGVVVDSEDDAISAIVRLISDQKSRQDISARCQLFMDEYFGESKVLTPYLKVLGGATQQLPRESNL